MLLKNFRLHWMVVRLDWMVVFVKKNRYYIQYFCWNKSANSYGNLYCNVEIHPKYKQEYYVHIKYVNWLVKILRTGRGRWVLRLQLSLSVSCSTSPGTSLCNAGVAGCFLQPQEFCHFFSGYLVFLSLNVFNFFPVFHSFFFLMSVLSSDFPFSFVFFSCPRPPVVFIRFLHLRGSISKYRKDSKFRKRTSKICY